MRPVVLCCCIAHASSSGVVCDEAHRSCMRDAEFRENKTMTDPDKLNLAYEKAVRGLSQLQKYTSLRPNASEWVIDLEQDPLGGPPPTRE